MIILPDRNIPRAKLLLPIPKHQWRTPSQAQPKDVFGNENQTRFRVRARLNDGFIKWVGWFDDREDFDRFLWAIADGSLWTDPHIQQLPTPFWPGLDPLITYDFATLTFLTTTGSNQTYTSPSDWNNINNTVECVGGGASGGAATGIAHCTGGGGGSYSKISNFSFATPGTTTATYNIAALAAAVTNSSGTNGNPTWFNNATDPGTGADNTKCSAKGGLKGASASGSQNGGAGGVTSTSWGETKNAGGAGGDLTGSSGKGGAGGGGAAGPAGIGGDGGNSSSTAANVTTAGGTGNNGTDAGGNAGGQNDGASGTEWDGSHGIGGGGGGNSASSAGIVAGSGGNYGGGGGGVTGTSCTSGQGIQGIIVTTYTPVPATGFGLSMLGL